MAEELNEMFLQQDGSIAYEYFSGHFNPVALKIINM
jgi:hypothetical protein